MPNDPAELTVADAFFAPAIQALTGAKSGRSCAAFPDDELIRAGVTRQLWSSESGRAFVQKWRVEADSAAGQRIYAAAHARARREAVVKEVADAVFNRVRRDCLKGDPLACLPALDGWAVVAGDGHFHAASTHDAARDTAGARVATGHVYMLDLRSGGLTHLDLAAGGAGRECDLSVIKRGIDDLKALRPGKKGGKLMVVWDRAAIDMRYWYNLKQTAGVYFTTRLKANLRYDITGAPEWDREARENTGVVSDLWVGFASGAEVTRLITVRDPETGEDIRIITNEMRLPPGIVAHLYRMRWNIEKVFDEVKNRLGQQQSWGASAECKRTHARFITLAHNLLTLFAEKQAQEHGVRDMASERRWEKSLAKREAAVAAGIMRATDRAVARVVPKNHPARAAVRAPARRIAAESALEAAGARALSPLLRLCGKLYQHTCRYIRWVTHACDSGTLLHAAPASLNATLNAPL